MAPIGDDKKNDVKSLLASNSYREIAKIVGISRSSISRIAAESDLSTKDNRGGRPRW
ncbi:unnamed protein product [Cunninghamella blakesleeana]